MEEAEKEDIESEANEIVDDTDVVADVEASSVNVAGKGKRKIHDEGAKTRKKKLILSTQMEKMENGFTKRRGKMENEVSQLREAFTFSGEASDPSKAKQAPHKRKADQAPAKKKAAGARLLELFIFIVLECLCNGNYVNDEKKVEIETNDFDFRLSTQELKDLSQDKFKLHDEQIEPEKQNQILHWCLCVTRIRTNFRGLPIGPTVLDFEVANRLMDPPFEWLHNSYGKGILPPHGRTQEIWNLDVDRLYKNVQGVGCVIKPCSSYCQGSSAKIPKDFDVTAYSVSYVPVGKLNKSALDCGVYAFKFIECHFLGFELSLVNDDSIKQARHIVLWDIWEASNDSELFDWMPKYVLLECLVSSVVEEIL
ncbi:hypothetical protein F2Q70_00027049 [Brassica cretica]|uniref:Ubiquitin-like protease family profile domain-containing protein n=1 Tax=Brassica cretica TaxID=69181 RepID=A0A8S9L5Q4_BRACR|nr:hypothetical protein F2Q70_00027049 [Brassica cretica]